MKIDSPLTYPEMATVKQKLNRSRLSDISAVVSSALLEHPVFKKTKPGKTVAVAVGSRGIDRVDQVVLECLKLLKEKGLRPFILPAMGSHGGGTREGQEKVLANLGISAERMGVPVHAEMDVESIDETQDGLKIFISKRALEADHIIPVNRIKPHTKFNGEIESGLCKMLTIGLGKSVGAAAFHGFAVNYGFNIIEKAAKTILEKCSILFGFALLEDGCGQLSGINVLPPETLIDDEKKLLKTAYLHMGKIPFDNIDVLIVDQIGKDISGIGMDSNVTGRHRDITGDFCKYPHVMRIFVRDLSPGTDGNGNGIGLADVTTKRLVNGLDIEKTYKNALTAISPEKAAIPIHFATDREAVDACVKTIGHISQGLGPRIVRIKNTASLEFIQVSRVFEQEIIANRNLELVSPWETMRFDGEGNLAKLSV